MIEIYEKDFRSQHKVSFFYGGGFELYAVVPVR